MKCIRVLRILLGFVILNAVVFLCAGKILSDESALKLVFHRVPTSEKVVALTYDDGPDPRFTPKILKILQKSDIKATFFMVGKMMEKNPEIVKQVVKEGHVIGNHTYTHPHDIELDSEPQIANELGKCENVIEKLANKHAWLFRPPRGLINGSVLTIAAKGGYDTVLWTVCADHHDAPTPELMAKRVFDRVEPGAIILLHDGSYGIRWKDVKATELIIQGLKKQGYRFVTIPELIEIGKNEATRAKSTEPVNPQTKTENRKPKRA